MDFILEGLSDLIKDKVGKCSSTKELWDKLHNIYFEESHPIMRPKHTDHKKEYVKSEREEICSSCQKDSEEEDCEEGIVYLEVELISSLDELKKEREENKSLEKELIKLKEGVQISKEVQVEEAKRIEETYKNQLEEKQCLEVEIASLRKEEEHK
jgi:hypothetical protein